MASRNCEKALLLSEVSLVSVSPPVDSLTLENFFMIINLFSVVFMSE